MGFISKLRPWYLSGFSPRGVPGRDGRDQGEKLGHFFPLLHPCQATVWQWLHFPTEGQGQGDIAFE